MDQWMERWMDYGWIMNGCMDRYMHAWIHANRTAGTRKKKGNKKKKDNRAK